MGALALWLVQPLSNVDPVRSACAPRACGLTHCPLARPALLQAAEDVDAPFGSLGSFFSRRLRERLHDGACLQLNPPYEPARATAPGSP